LSGAGRRAARDPAAAGRADACSAGAVVNPPTLRAAPAAVQRAPQAKLLVVTADGRIVHTERARLADVLRAGDLVVANDGATLPASLSGTHGPSGAPIEVRLAGRRTLRVDDVRAF